LQRWLNRDPICENGGINLYGFVDNNSINLYEPYGLYTLSEWWEIVKAGGSGWSDAANDIGKSVGGTLAGNWDYVAGSAGGDFNAADRVVE
jgi:hypothetical protein